jgi:hypothetical protein
MSTNMSAARLALAMTIGLGLSLGLASCNDDDKGRDRTISSVARSEIKQNSSDTAEPILIDDLPLSDRDTRETDLPGPI